MNKDKFQKILSAVLIAITVETIAFVLRKHLQEMFDK